MAGFVFVQRPANDNQRRLIDRRLADALLDYLWPDATEARRTLWQAIAERRRDDLPKPQD